MSHTQPIAACECQRVCKPGSVHPQRRDRRPFLSDDACAPSPATNPGSGPEHAPKRLRASCRPYSVLLPVGFAMPLPLPAARCALTAPFHRNPAEAKGRLLSVALSLNPRPKPEARRALPGTVVSVEPGLSSARSSRDAAARPSDTRVPSGLSTRVQSSPCGLGSNSARSSIRHSPSMMPSIISGRNRRWNAVTAASRSATS